MDNDEIPSLWHLRIFAQVATCGSMSCASKTLFRSQSVISRAIHSLEEHLGTSLFERASDGVVLTSHGQLCASRLTELFTEAEVLVGSPLDGRPCSRELGALNTKRLKLFVSIWEAGNLSRAAQLNGMTQPAVSLSLRALEHALGLQLFRRLFRRMEPTEAGSRVYEPIKRILRHIEMLKSDINQSRNILQGTVCVGALPLGRTNVLPLAITRSLKIHPGIQVVTKESSFELMMKAMRTGDLDFIFGAIRPALQEVGIVVEVLFEEKLLVTCRAGHPLANKKMITHEALSAADWILPRSDSPARQLLDAQFRSESIAIKPPAVETGDLAVIRGLLVNSDMLAVVSEQQMSYELETGLLVAIQINLAKTQRAIGMAYMDDGTRSPAAEHLMAQIREVGKEVTLHTPIYPLACASIEFSGEVVFGQRSGTHPIAAIQHR